MSSTHNIPTDRANTQTGTAVRATVNTGRRLSTETKSSYKTTELIAYVAAVLGVLISSAVVDASDFGAQEAWWFVTVLTVGYMISRGLAMSGSREPNTDDTGCNHR